MDQTERFLALEAASIDAATHGFKALLILNGGACGALFAFTALLATSEYLRPEFAPLIPAMARSLSWFGGGALMAALTWLLAYWANQAYASATINHAVVSWNRGTRLNQAGTLAAGLSLLGFGMGVVLIVIAMP